MINTPINPTRLDLVSKLESAIRLAGWHINESWPGLTGKPVAFTTKPDGSPVTPLDVKSSNLLINALHEAGVSDHIVSEEGEHAQVATNQPAWYIDPLDGTKQYIAGKDFYAIFVGRKLGDDFTFGMMYYPALNIFLSGGQGLQTKCNFPDNLFRPSSNKDGAFIASRAVDYSGNDRIDIDFPTRNLPIISVVAGRAEAAVANFPKGSSLWDVCASLAIATNAGLVVTDSQGRPLEYSGHRLTSTSVVVARPNRHQQFIDKLQSGQAQ